MMVKRIESRVGKTEPKKNYKDVGKELREKTLLRLYWKKIR